MNAQQYIINVRAAKINGQFVVIRVKKRIGFFIILNPIFL